MSKLADFRAFSQAGRDLADWYLNYETVACHPGVTVVVGKEAGPYCPSSSAEEATVRSPLLMLTAAQFGVIKMKSGKTKDASGKNVNDKSTVIYNEYIRGRFFRPD